VKRPNVETALSEALYMTDLERNADVVVMSSYAPMLCKEGHHNWDPNMIYFDNIKIKTTPAYEIQRIFGNYCGDRYIASTIKSEKSELDYRLGASVVKDSKTGKTYVKLVNALPVELQLDVKGIQLNGAKGEGFNGKPEERKLNCEPITLGEQITLPPYSLRVVEL